jgi:AcrR family transcriptional regulator
VSEAAKKSDRKRLQPEERKDMLLESAVAYLRDHGIATLTMDRLAQNAGVSKPLMYNYFPNRMALLKAVLVREVNMRRARDAQIAKEAETLEDLIRMASRHTLEHIQARGNIIQQLLQEPEIAQVMTDMRSEARGGYVDYITKKACATYDLPPDIARVVVQLLMNMGTNAGALFDREKGDIDQAHDILLTLTTGAIEAAVRKYAKKPRA